MSDKFNSLFVNTDEDNILLLTKEIKRMLQSKLNKQNREYQNDVNDCFDGRSKNLYFYLV